MGVYTERLDWTPEQKIGFEDAALEFLRGREEKDTTRSVLGAWLSVRHPELVGLEDLVWSYVLSNLGE
jgi:hypothetical protein